MHKEGSGEYRERRPAFPQDIEMAGALIQSNRRIKLDGIAREVGIASGTLQQMKKDMAGKQFSRNDEVKSALTWLCASGQNFFQIALHKQFSCCCKFSAAKVINIKTKCIHWS